MILPGAIVSSMKRVQLGLILPRIDKNWSCLASSLGLQISSMPAASDFLKICGLLLGTPMSKSCFVNF